MKKILLTILAFILAVPVFSQEKNRDMVKNQDLTQYQEILDDLKEDIKEGIKDAVDNPDDKEYSPLVWESEDGLFKVFTVSHIGYGLYFISNTNFVPALSGEFFVNLVRCGFYPVEDWGLEINLDFGHNALRSTESVLLLDNDREVYSVPASELYPSGSRGKRSTLEFMSLNFPFLLKHDYGDFSFGLGTEVSVNFAGRAKYKYSTGYDTHNFVGKRAAINTFTYAFEATASYDDLGLFIKWYPRHSGILSGRNLDMRTGYVSIGVSFGL